MRREFQLPQNDEQYLNNLGLSWETVREGGSQWLIIHDWPIPVGYRQMTAAVAVLIDPNYPDVQIDMAFFYPALTLANGRSIKATEGTQTLDGKQWQRWSRHRTSANPWRPGLDDLSTHLTQVGYWLARESPEVLAA